MAHHVEARHDDSDGAFLPPLRTIGFNPKLTLNDSLLAQSYVEAYDLSYPEAVMRIDDEIRELKQHLENDGSYELFDIGLLRLNDDGAYEFEPCEAGILTPSLYGLSSFEMKSVAELDRELETQNLIEEKTAVPTLALQTQAFATSISADEVDEPRNRQVSMWRNLAVACIALLVFLLFPAPLANNSLVQESSIDTSLLQRIMPKNVTIVDNHRGDTTRPRPKAPQMLSKNNKAQSSTLQKTSGYTLVLASKITRRNASEYIDQLHKKGFNEADIYIKGKSTKVIFGNYATQGEAYACLNKLHEKEPFAEAWVMKR